MGDYYQTHDIGLATFLDYWIWGVQVQKVSDRSCIFFIENPDFEKINEYVNMYHTMKDNTPAKAYRQKYKELSTIVGRLMQWS